MSCSVQDLSTHTGEIQSHGPPKLGKDHFPPYLSLMPAVEAFRLSSRTKAMLRNCVHKSIVEI